MRDEEVKPNETGFYVSDNDDVEVFVGGMHPNCHSEQFMDEINDDNYRSWVSYAPTNKTRRRQCNEYLKGQEKSFTIYNGHYKLNTGSRVRDVEELSYYSKHGDKPSTEEQRAIDANEPIVEYYQEQFDDLYSPQKIKL